jgi:7-cyano-7-deazaguanine synthase
MADNAVVLTSGGLDSTTCLAIARQAGYALFAMSFDYGQRHKWELESARRAAVWAGAAEHRIVTIDLAAFGGSALTSDLAVPHPGADDAIGDAIPITYVPARNTIFLSYALAWAEVLGARHIFIGVNAMDYSGYPDCRPEYIAAFERMANLATRAGVTGAAPVEIHTPLIALSKREIVERGVALGVDFSITHTCYDPDAQGRACGQCEACVLRLRGFQQAGRIDPAPYQSRASD